MATISTPGKLLDTQESNTTVVKAGSENLVVRLDLGLFRYIPNYAYLPSNKTEEQYQTYWG